MRSGIFFKVECWVFEGTECRWMLLLFLFGRETDNLHEHTIQEYSPSTSGDNPVRIRAKINPRYRKIDAYFATLEWLQMRPSSLSCEQLEVDYIVG